jgi:hypothetical protein
MAKTDGLLAEIQAANKDHHRICTVRKILEALGNEADQLRAALADRSIKSSAISRVLAARDLKVSGEVVSRHRRGECSCES